ncbi:PH domain-containing protein [Planococcus salinus]|uniref:YokE-like PH domain-containing protein n=1 Tax=Planococcus salinus TaxID=1848460 RepID=A0A3M8P4W2_9BACL|nr:PH domain-containing protein [Planococcus salinus]RNF38706.1 hypothetical protein EEX84_12790 [Planococcus salinus]
MTHPARLAEDLKKKMPHFPFRYWVFGLFHTTHIENVKGVKGLLAAAENRLIFFAKTAEKEDFCVSVHYNKIDYIEARTSGNASISCFLTDGSQMEMTLISRGDYEKMAEFLHEKCGGSLENNFSRKADSL